MWLQDKNHCVEMGTAVFETLANVRIVDFMRVDDFTAKLADTWNIAFDPRRRSSNSDECFLGHIRGRCHV